MAWELVGKSALGSTHQLEIWFDVRGQNVGSNTTSLAVELGIRRTATNSGAYWSNNADSSGAFKVNGNNINIPGFSYDFRSSTYKVLGGTVLNIPHNADGSKTVSASASVNIGSGLLSSGSASGSKKLTTIPRATTPSVNVSRQDFGEAVVVSMPRAANNFHHKLWYRINSGTWITIADNLGTSYTWTLPLNEMNKIPNATTATVELWVSTFNGSIDIGYKTTSFTGVVPNNIVPSIGTVTASEFVADVKNKVGTYVQGFSRISVAASGGAGSYGSTISSWRIAGHGLNVASSSGTSSVISISGLLIYTATVTDSRGRTATKTVSITALKYDPPVVDKFEAIRTNSTGAPVWNGTYIKSTIKTHITSLINAGQKNTLTIYLDQRINGASGWTNFRTISKGAIITVDEDHVNGTFDVTKGYEIRIRIVDVFGSTTSSVVQISSGTVALDIGTQDIGVGKFWERGSIDAIGQIYQNNGKMVIDESMIGVPIDSYGSNQYGTWVKYTNGELYQRGTASHDSPYGYRNKWGNTIFHTDYHRWFYPIPFVGDLPFLQITGITRIGGEGWVSIRNNGELTKTPDTYMCRPNTTTTRSVVDYHWEAWGRWK